jgi:hypothetical protein
MDTLHHYLLSGIPSTYWTANPGQKGKNQLYFKNKKFAAQHWWLIHVILAAWEDEIRKIVV